MNKINKKLINNPKLLIQNIDLLFKNKINQEKYLNIKTKFS